MNTGRSRSCEQLFYALFLLQVQAAFHSRLFVLQQDHKKHWNGVLLRSTC